MRRTLRTHSSTSSRELRVGTTRVTRGARAGRRYRTWRSPGARPGTTSAAVPAGRLDERYDEVDDLVRARHVPSPQLVGTPERADLDLNALTSSGASLVGRLSAVNGSTASFSGSLRNVCNLADLKLKRLLNTIDEWAGLDEGPRPEPTRVDEHPRVLIDLVAEGFDTVLWATGFRADYSWLDVPVCDRKGEIRHDGGVVPHAPGLYRIGLNFLRRRKSSFIHGAEDDAREIVEHLVGHLAVA